MVAVKLFLSFMVFGTIVRAAEFRPSGALSSDATQADLLSQIDKGVLDFSPSIVAPIQWVIYPEDQTKIAVVPADRKKTIVPAKIEEIQAEAEFGEDADLDQMLLQ